MTKAAAPGQPARAERLSGYQAKRRFHLTPEPPADQASVADDATTTPPGPGLRYVIQKHWASRLHYDFRLEFDGVLLSWAVPRGPSFDPKDKRMAVHVEDHPISYGGFEGTIPPGQYGAGRVIVWDRGTWTPVGDPRAGLAAGKLIFELHGEKLAGRWELVRIAKPGDRQDPWMLFKKRDAWARPSAEYDVIAALPDSVMTHPLGMAEAREPREGPPPMAPATSGGDRPDDAAAVIAQAKPAPLPARLEPQLATAATALPPTHRWALEPKWDGYRILARIDHGRARLYTRKGHDWTDKMRTLATAVEQLGLDQAWLDGEIVVLGADGAPDFNALQNAMDGARSDDIVYFLFDLPFADGRDLRPLPWWARRARLRELLGPQAPGRLRFSPDFDVPPAQLMEATRAMRLEGIVAKRLDAPYVSARTATWLKLKSTQRQEFVVLGYTDRANAPAEVGSLMLGYHDGQALRYAGNVGTGWDHRTATALYRRLASLQTPRAPVDPGSIEPGRWSRRVAGSEHWVKPQMVVEVQFADWTPDGKVRAGVFKGERIDKPASEVVREPDTVAEPSATATRPVGTFAAGTSTAGSTSPTPHLHGIKITHPERVIDHSTGLRKIDVVRYYDSVADWLLPHLKDRPVSLVRAPEGVNGELFFQKHPDSKIPGLRALPPDLWPDHGALLAVDDAPSLVAAAQMNVLEFHTWNATTRHIDKPDRVVFDLDPGEGVAWKDVQEAAVLVHTLLDTLGLQCWLKTSGGKGLHVVVPISPRWSHDKVKAFSKATVEHLARTLPQKFVAIPGPKHRVGKVFVDYLRNNHAATTAAAFSARSRPGLGVSMPLSWSQLTALKSSAQWTIANAREYLSFQQDDPWAGYWDCRQTLTHARKMLAD
ncbi:DNA ligase D [Ideonella sp. DXS29W]|uniref:DNA ligase (ATP) n=1 Tax=Ideonella lacteola TaxID=2984193 RepID=A0ABU9BS00_9BURK